MSPSSALMSGTTAARLRTLRPSPARTTSAKTQANHDEARGEGGPRTLPGGADAAPGAAWSGVPGTEAASGRRLETRSGLTLLGDSSSREVARRVVRSPR